MIYVLSKDKKNITIFHLKIIMLQPLDLQYFAYACYRNIVVFSGDKVSVQNSASYVNTVTGDGDTMFSGYLIQPDEESV